jgi:hypothetical protein
VRQVEQYRAVLSTLEDWDSFLLEESRLPGPRANLELLQAVADEGQESMFLRWIRLTPDQAPTNSPQVFLAVCGVVGLGRLLAEGRSELLSTLRPFASDPRWRIREGVAMALQRLGERDMDMLLREMEEWCGGNLLEKRAAAAALCEPRLLSHKEHAERVLHLLDQITASLLSGANRRGDDFQALRKGLGYCWSVAVAAYPAKGKELLEKWFSSTDPDVRWIMKENLSKNRLLRMDATWVQKSSAQLRRESPAAS